MSININDGKPDAARPTMSSSIVLCTRWPCTCTHSPLCVLVSEVSNFKERRQVGIPRYDGLIEVPSKRVKQLPVAEHLLKGEDAILPHPRVWVVDVPGFGGRF